MKVFDNPVVSSPASPKSKFTRERGDAAVLDIEGVEERLAGQARRVSLSSQSAQTNLSVAYSCAIISHFQPIPLSISLLLSKR